MGDLSTVIIDVFTDKTFVEVTSFAFFYVSVLCLAMLCL